MKTRIGIILILLFSLFVSHLRHFNLGPRGTHVWRQCNSLAVAKNYAQEAMHFSEPRVDHRKSTNGVTGMNFPLYEYLLAAYYKIFGFSDSAHRFFQFFMAALCLIGFFLFCTQTKLALWPCGIAAFALAWSPEFYYYSITALPDIMALGFSIWALYFYQRAIRRPDLLFFFAIWICIGLAGLIKLQFIMFGAFILAHLLLRRRWDLFLPSIIIFLPVLAGVLNWYMYAIELRRLNHLYDFGLFLNPGSELSKWDILKGNLVSTIPELLIGYAILPFMIGGLILYFVREKRLNLLMAILVFLCLLGFHLLELGQMKHHSYYMLPYLPFAAFLTAYAFHRLKKNMLIPGILIILIQMPLTKLRIDHRFTDKHAGIPTEFQKNAQLDSLRSNLDPNALSLVGPDPSGCIFLYYLQLKGYNAFGLSQIRDETEIAHALDSGIIEQIVLRSENPEYALPAFYVKEQQIGAFCIYRKSFQ